MFGAFMVAFIYRLVVCAGGFLLGLLRGLLWLATVPLWDAAVLSIAALMWFAGGLVGAELPKLQLEQFGFLTFQWDRPMSPRWQRSCR